MRSVTGSSIYQAPIYLEQAGELARYVNNMSTKDIAKCMKISDIMADKTKKQFSAWSLGPESTLPAIDIFLGDIYSGLQSATFSEKDRNYANKHLIILSGLYGGLRALDNICPYRLEMGYRLPDEPYKNLYKFWSDSISKLLPENGAIINVSSEEYTKAVLPYVDENRVITPRFMTISPKTGQPTFVVVHAKIARGAFARWLIQTQVQDNARLREFDLLGYKFDDVLSTPESPVFVCKSFQGLGLSVRLTV